MWEAESWNPMSFTRRLLDRNYHGYQKLSRSHGISEQFVAFIAVSFRIARCVLGIALCIWLPAVPLGIRLVPLAGWFSETSTVKVHEWCLVCYGWLALCLRNNCHPTYLFSFCLGLYSLSRLWVSCVAYLRHGIVPIDQSFCRLVSS